MMMEGGWHERADNRVAADLRVGDRVAADPRVDNRVAADPRVGRGFRKRSVFGRLSRRIVF